MTSGPDPFGRWRVPVRSSEGGHRSGEASASPTGGFPDPSDPQAPTAPPTDQDLGRLAADRPHDPANGASGDRTPDDGSSDDRTPDNRAPTDRTPEDRTPRDQAGDPSPEGAASSDVAPGTGPDDLGPDGEAGAPGEAAPEAILSDTAALAAERDEYLTALQRVQAEFANYRKRVQRLQEEQSARAATELVTKLLPVLDVLDLARTHLPPAGEEPSVEAKALDQAESLLVDVLAREGLERVDQAEVAFDPTVHDAVAHAPVDDEPAGDTSDRGNGTGAMVDEVLRAGYRWRGQVLRPAMVRVRG
jgi:molecular chaperone GrpE